MSVPHPSYPLRSVTAVETVGTLKVRVGQHVLPASPAFHSFWHLAAERQRIFFKRLGGEQAPWTEDAVLRSHRFTNAYRASDRVSQYLINEVIYNEPVDPRSLVLRVLLFKIFNRVDTWQALERSVGKITVDTFDTELFDDVLEERRGHGQRIYSAAYIMPTPRLGELRKHANHLRLLERLLVDGSVDDIVVAPSLKRLYDALLAVPSFGSFLAFQFAIDLNYSALYDFSEMDFVVAGPGAHDGIAKCFPDTDGLQAEDVIRAMAEGASSFLDTLDIDFQTLWGRPLQLVDCQNLFCEVGKYARVVHPELAGRSGRTQIKQKYRAMSLPLRPLYPPRWALEYDPAIPVAASGSAESAA
jgi:hypothetical protein